MTQNIRFGQKVASAKWIEQTQKWEISIDDGEKLDANVLIDGTGALHVPHIPKFPGMVCL